MKLSVFKKMHEHMSTPHTIQARLSSTNVSPFTLANQQSFTADLCSEYYELDEAPVAAEPIEVIGSSRLRIHMKIN